MNSEQNEVIQYHIENNLLLNLERCFNGDTNVICGFPVLCSEKFIMITVIVDFHNEGYAILRAEDIIDAYSNESDVFYEQICIAEGLQKKNIPDCISDISTIKHILLQLQNYKGFISIQCEKQVEKCTFFMGEILEVHETYVLFKDLDMHGNWDEELNKIYFDEITQITFADNYSKMYYKYVDKD